MKRLIVVIVLTTAIGLLASSESFAVHKGSGDLTCGQCHTMHNSQGGSSLGGNANGSLVLLRANVTDRSKIHNLCLQCHSSNGAQGGSAFAPHSNSAPKVLLDSTVASKWDQTTAFNKIGAGGDFQYACGNGDGGSPPYWADCLTADGGAVAQGKGHSLGATTVTPPGSTDGSIAAFTCTSCHDPHGTDSDANADINRFRNLRKKPTDSGAATVALTVGDFSSWVGGITGTFATTGKYFPVDQATGNADAVAGTTTTKAIWPVYKGSTALSGLADIADSARSNSYGGGAAGISRWCAECHDNWHETNTATNKNGNDWQRHPVDNILDEAASPNSGAGVDIFDPANYAPATAGQVLPVASAQAANRVFYTTAANAASDKVMCLSCHFAHGGAYYDNLRWDYLSAVGAGTQSANGVPSTKGCQLCHNRGS